jgi:hypothetical protein
MRKHRTLNAEHRTCFVEMIVADRGNAFSSFAFTGANVEQVGLSGSLPRVASASRPDPGLFSVALSGLERLKKYCSHSAKGIERAVFLVFGIVSSQLQGLLNLLLRRSLAKNQKSALRIGCSISLSALGFETGVFYRACRTSNVRCPRVSLFRRSEFDGRNLMFTV